MPNDKSIDIIYDNISYSREQFNSILNEFNKGEIEIRELHQKAFGDFPTIVIIICNVGMFIAQGFFKKCGEKLAEILFDKLSEKEPRLGISFNESEKPKINILIKPNNIHAVKSNMTDDNIKEIYELILCYINKNNLLDIKEITVVLNQDLLNIENMFYIDNNNNVYNVNEAI